MSDEYTPAEEHWAMTIGNMDANDLEKLLKAYDQYIINYMDDNGVCTNGNCPCCVNEFYDNEFLKTFTVCNNQSDVEIKVELLDLGEVHEWIEDNLKDPENWYIWEEEH